VSNDETELTFTGAFWDVKSSPAKTNEYNQVIIASPKSSELDGLVFPSLEHKHRQNTIYDRLSNVFCKRPVPLIYLSSNTFAAVSSIRIRPQKQTRGTSLPRYSQIYNRGRI
jgi:hypothetical protein